ncbi:MAG: hypothetical protein ABIG39_06695 [Candidatus Micrarchaeota archaeon]
MNTNEPKEVELERAKTRIAEQDREIEWLLTENAHKDHDLFQAEADNRHLQERVRELRKLLKKLYKATEADPYVISGHSINGHPLNALGVARQETKQALQHKEGEE